MSDPYEADFVDESEDEPEEEPDEEDEAELEDDTPEEEPSEDEGEEEEPPARQPSRGDKRVATATRIAAEAKREAAAVKAELEALRSAQSRTSEAQQHKRDEMLANMEPLEREVFLLKEKDSSREFALNDRLDKMSFESLCARNPAAAKLQSKVESELAALRARGQNVDREVMLKFVIGEQALANATRATGRAVRTAATNRERQAARPGSTRSDTPAADRRAANSAAARQRRLEDYQL